MQLFVVQNIAYPEYIPSKSQMSMKYATSSLPNKLNIIYNHWTKTMTLKYTFARNIIKTYLNLYQHIAFPLRIKIMSAIVVMPIWQRNIIGWWQYMSTVFQRQDDMIVQVNKHRDTAPLKPQWPIWVSTIKKILYFSCASSIPTEQMHFARFISLVVGQLWTPH